MRLPIFFGSSINFFRNSILSISASVKLKRTRHAALPEKFCSSFFVASVEFLNASAGFNVALSAREERVTFRANVNAQFLFGGAGFERVAATASDGRFEVLRMKAGV